MPIYVYRCAQCGLEKEILQKVSDALLTDCPACHQSTFTKQLTAAGFQLKGSGWYETDFKNSPKPKVEKEDAGKVEPVASAPAAGVTPTKTDDANASSKRHTPEPSSSKAGDSSATN